jgi:hypothetical protein
MKAFHSFLALTLKSLHFRFFLPAPEEPNVGSKILVFGF